MLNQVVLVGRLTKDVEIKKEGEKDVAYITLAVSRSYKNEDGNYDTDFIDVKLWNGIATSTSEYCKKGDIVGVKGRIESLEIDGNRQMQLVVEKVTFLSSKSEDK